MRLLVDNPQRILLPGMYIQGENNTCAHQRRCDSPREAVVHENDKAKVWLNQEGKAKAVTVELGGSIGADYYVRQGLKTGDRLIIRG